MYSRICTEFAGVNFGSISRKLHVYIFCRLEMNYKRRLCNLQNLEKESQITELRNQCRIIRTSELADAQEKLNNLERQKEEIMKCYSPASLLQKLQGN
ncbi:hypothetical protein RND81_09G191700 [Saponaria officinalis]|uniref:VPS37 C-terminal domain-containing protein n=1 Tax=Saponaria officinalis TaxID=3572 RepID=A0AAW1IMV7_SAPOF